MAQSSPNTYQKCSSSLAFIKVRFVASGSLSLKLWHFKQEYAVVRLVRNIVILEVFGIVMYFIFSFKYAARPENIGMVVSIVVHTFLAFMIIFPPCKNFLEKMFIACVSKDNDISLPGCDIIKRSSSICETAGSAVEDNVCNFPSVAKSVIVNGYFFLIRKIFAVGTKTAEETLFFHIQTVKKTFKTVKTEVADIRQMDIKYHQADQGAEDLTVHKTLLFTYKFNYREEYKNTYLTEEFEKIDLDMALRGRTKALPLNKDEKLVILSTAFDFMGMVRVDYPSHFEIKVSGEGESAKMMRGIQNVFSPLTSDIRNRDETWRNCFVEPTPPNEDTRWTIILMFIAAIFLCRFQVWMSRQTLALADYFFPDRVRPRALMLYNRILMDRKNVLGAMMEQQKVRVE
ncbi:unnamed protein product [Nippostrongylus brasiliensis]|uniref:DC_STAMP domain-containing protein n=1 Tax=Nippostrongylus brasiliensis TaxID=27835 RepID=A0A0N4Y9B9_NIPBR|nr:unnamed protein product [Nippostrongylus brasiliensis]